MKKTIIRLQPILSPVLLLLTSAHHLSQFIFLGELARENTQVSNQLVTSGHDCLLGSDLAVGLDSKFKLRNQRVRHLEITGY